MTPDLSVPSAPPSRVSILARIIPAMSYALTALGAAGSAYLFLGVIRAMREAEAAGIGVVSLGVSRANLVVVVMLYLAIVVGFAGIVMILVRLFVSTNTAAPSAWFYFITGVLGFAPMFALWQAQSLLLNMMFSRSGNIALLANQIIGLLMFALGVGIVSILVLIVSSVIPLPRVLHSRRKWAPPVVLVVMEIVVIVMTVLYHIRTAWLYNQYMERF
ncbi:MAG TPA: hypothetical protein VJT71_05745 [Pyrinomonadaceae bacterium]|nr:hypothetical protein [Pyrinomonadaceae bacterium]